MARLGTRKRPAIARVQTEERAKEIAAVCEEHGWQCTIGVEPDKPEDISDVTKLLSKTEKRPAPSEHAPRVTGNDYCPCGSGKKFKKCCQMSGQPVAKPAATLSAPPAPVPTAPAPVPATPPGSPAPEVGVPSEEVKQKDEPKEPDAPPPSPPPKRLETKKSRAEPPAKGAGSWWKRKLRLPFS